MGLPHLCPLDGYAVAAARGQPDVLDGVRVQQVHAPPRRLLALCLGALKKTGRGFKSSLRVT